MASLPDIAHSLAMTCLGHEQFVLRLADQADTEDLAASVGLRVGEFYGGVLEAVHAVFSAKPGGSHPAPAPERSEPAQQSEE